MYYCCVCVWPVCDFECEMWSWFVCGGQKTNFRSQFSASTMRIELGFHGCMTSILPLSHLTSPKMGFFLKKKNN